MIAIIAAYARNRIIGNKGKLVWNIPSDKKRFRELTDGNVVIMGRRTYEEIGSPLSNRLNIVLSSTVNFAGQNLVTAGTLTEALAARRAYEEFADSKIFICGGARVYKEALPVADELYLSVIDREYEGDVYFPEYDERMYECVYKEHLKEEIPYTFYRYIRK